MTHLKRWEILGILFILLPESNQVNAQSSESNSSIIAQAIGISLATSVVTTLITLAIVYVVHKHFKKKNRRKEFTRDPEVRSSLGSNAPSTRPLMGRQTSGSGSYTEVPLSAIDLPVDDNTFNRPNGVPKNRRIKSDFISKWCTDHKLTEQTAHCLRIKGFTYKEALDSLRPEDIHKLEIRNTAQECLLRDILIKMRPPQRPHYGSQGSMMRKRSKSTSEENMAPHSPTGHNSSTSSSRLDKSQSMDDIDGAAGVATGNTLQFTVKKRNMGSMEIIDDESKNESTIIIRGGNGRGSDAPGLVHRTVLPNNDRRNNPKNFKGLLSDKGLWDLARMIGSEWPRLGTLLEIPTPVQDQIRMDYPNKTHQQIYEMLRLWRDTARGSKESIKGKLHTALVTCDRQDLAEDLLLEQVEGSAEKVAYHSII